VNLVGTWNAGPYTYQLWEMDTEYVCQSIDTRTLETVCEGRGNNPLEAITDGVREALRALT
jgi:hypothetical protein